MKERLINTRFWSDGFVREKLNPLDRYLFLYFLTNEKTNISGIYELPRSIMSWETGIEEKTLLDMIVRLKGKVEYVDGWIILVNFLKYQRTASDSVVIGINKSLKEAPKNIIEYAFSIGYGDDTPIIPPSSHISESESESESEQKVRVKKIFSWQDKKGNPIPIVTGDVYQPDFWSPYQQKQMFKSMERAVGKGKSTKWSQITFGVAWDYKKLFKQFMGYEYAGSLKIDEWVKTAIVMYESGETRETVKAMLIDFFQSEKAKKVTVTPTSALSDHTYNSYKQGKLSNKEDKNSILKSWGV